MNIVIVFQIQDHGIYSALAQAAADDLVPSSVIARQALVRELRRRG